MRRVSSAHGDYGPTVRDMNKSQKHNKSPINRSNFYFLGEKHLVDFFFQFLHITLFTNPPHAVTKGEWPLAHPCFDKKGGATHRICFGCILYIQAPYGA